MFWIFPKSWKIKPNREEYFFLNVKVFFPKVSIVWFLKFRQIIKFIKKNQLKFTLIHSHFVYPSWEIWNYLKKYFNVNHISSARWSEIRIPLSWIKSNIFYKLILKIKLKKILNWLDFLTTSHEELRDLLIFNYSEILKYKFLFFKKGVDLKKFNKSWIVLKSKANLLIHKYKLKDKFVVLFIWSLIDFKDPLTFIQSALDFQSNKEVVFLLVWNWNLMDELQKFKQTNKLDNFIICWPSSDTEVFYYIADVFCALSPFENIWSNTIIEAFCMWLPCIITNSWYTKRILEDGNWVVLINSNKSWELSEKINHFKNNISYKNKMSDKAYNFWIRNFDDSKNISSLIKIYAKFKK
jgi:glycosyltransferase involved in cell wall biosynthesis